VEQDTTKYCKEDNIPTASWRE